MVTETTETSALKGWVAKNSGFQAVYNSYEPDLAMIEKIKQTLPQAHVIVVAEYWCGDSRRTVPRVARVLDAMPEWTTEVLPWDGASRREPLRARAIPTLIVFKGETEIGRIVENPQYGTVEDDLMAIATDAAAGE